MHTSRFIGLFCTISLLWGCHFVRSEEQVVETYADGSKKTSFWVYPDGEIQKQNEWYNNGIKKREVEFKDNLPHGLVRQWTYLGDVVLEGYYQKGKREGEWNTFFSSKKKQSTRYYKDDHEVGDCYGIFPDGSPAFEEHYSDEGDSIGVWKKWHNNGKIAEENSCFRKVPEGVLKKYSFDGNLETEDHCRNGFPGGLHLEYYPNGKTVKVLENIQRCFAMGRNETQMDCSHKHGPRTLFYGNGKIMKQEFWKGGIRDSVWTWFDSEGNKIVESLEILDENGSNHRQDYGVCGKEVCAESTFVKMKSSSMSTSPEEFVLNGTVRYKREGHDLTYEETWVYGEHTESRSFYNQDSTSNAKGILPQLASEGTWKNGKRNGIWRNWYKNGVLKDSLTYIDGERVGEQFGYDSTGALTIHKTENGKNKPVIVHILGAN